MFREVTMWLDSVIFLNLGGTLELLGGIFVSNIDMLGHSPDQMNWNVCRGAQTSGFVLFCFKVPRIILQCVQSRKTLGSV